MDYLTSVPMDFFKWVLSTSAMACLIVGLILLVKFVLGNRLKPRWQYILWLLLTLRLILPWTPESPFSIFNLIKFPVNPDSKVINYNLGNQITQTKVFSEVPSVQSQVSESNHLIILQIVFWVWVLGVIFFGVYTIIINRKFAYILQRQTCISDPNILKVFENCKKEMFIQRAMSLMGSNQVTSPTIFGFLHPYIIISEVTSETLTLEQFRYIFLHELAHYKRKDIAINWLMQGLLIIHWFNPILWYAFRRMREDQEIACDALALTQIHSDESNEYGQTIITLLESFSEQKQIPGMANLSDNKAQLKRRITMIKLYKKNSYRWSLLGVAVLIGLGGLFLTNGKTSAIASDRQNESSKMGGKPQASAGIAGTYVPDKSTILEGEVGTTIRKGDLIFERIESDSRSFPEQVDGGMLAGNQLTKLIKNSKEDEYCTIWFRNAGSGHIIFTITKGSPAGAVVSGGTVRIPAYTTWAISTIKPWTAGEYYANFTSGSVDMSGQVAFTLSK